MKHERTSLFIGKIGIFLLLITIFFSFVISGYFIHTSIVFLCGFFLLLPIARIPLRLNILIRKKSDIAFFIAIVVMFFSYLFHNSVFRVGNEGFAISFICFSVLIFFMSYSENWTDFLCKWLLKIAVFFPIITIIFFVFPSFCSAIMKPLWLNALGTTYATGGYNDPYKVGFTIHYSTNGIFCSIACICCYLRVLFNRKKIWKILLALSFLGLLLTTKRAHLLFTAFAFLVTYYFVKPENRAGRLIKALLVIFSAFILIIIASGFIPEIAETFERFNVGSAGDISNRRFDLWAIAIEGFKSNPLFGTGWYGYCLLYNKHLLLGIEDQHAHNVYIQMLCENGIIGLICYLIIIIYIFLKTVELIKKASNKDNNYHYYLSLSLCIQTFFISYSLTGNCLYDLTYYFYALACALTFYVSRKINESEQKLI